MDSGHDSRRPAAAQRDAGRQPPPPLKAVASTALRAVQQVCVCVSVCACVCAAH